MAVRMHQAWVPITSIETILRGQLGVYQLADAREQVLYIGFAGGRSLHGLRGEVSDRCAELSQRGLDIALFRHEVTTAYLSRYRELLMVFRADHGGLPQGNTDDLNGRLSPA